MKCSFCDSDTSRKVEDNKPVEREGVSGLVHEYWLHCNSCDWKVWGGYEESLDDGVNWASIQVFYGVDGPIGLTEEDQCSKK